VIVLSFTSFVQCFFLVANIYLCHKKLLFSCLRLLVFNSVFLFCVFFFLFLILLHHYSVKIIVLAVCKEKDAYDLISDVFFCET